LDGSGSQSLGLDKDEDDLTRSLIALASKFASGSMLDGPGCAKDTEGGMEGAGNIGVGEGDAGWMAGVERLEDSRRVNSSGWPAL